MTRRFAVIFGRKQSDTAILQGLADLRSGTPAADARRFEPGVTPALRFASDDGERHPPSRLADIPETADKLVALKAALSRDLDVFARNQRRLLDLYFDFIGGRLHANADILAERLRHLGGLFRLADWAFSALRPLPNAAVFDADEADSAPPVLVHDFAFWTGDQVLAIRIRGSGTPSARETDILARLQASGVGIATIPAADLATGTAIFSEARFPAAFLNFWDGAAYPCSPFRPQGLPDTLSVG